MVLGSHVTKAWSATQASVSLSSGEAEFYGVVRAAGIGLGIQALMRDAGISIPLRVWTDSESAMGTAGRQGLGKLRHLECHSLWLQQRLRRKELVLLKVPGVENPADLFTKHLESQSKLDQLLGKFNCKIVEGRPAAAPQLKKAPAAVHNVSATESFGSGNQMRRSTGKNDQLPHLASGGDMSQFETAVPGNPMIGEPDLDPDDGLADPVPQLVRDPAHDRRRGLTRTTTTAKGRSRAPDRSRMKRDGPGTDRVPGQSQVRREAVRGERSSHETLMLVTVDTDNGQEEELEVVGNTDDSTQQTTTTHARLVTEDNGPGVQEADMVVVVGSGAQALGPQVHEPQLRQVRLAGEAVRCAHQWAQGDRQEGQRCEEARSRRLGHHPGCLCRGGVLGGEHPHTVYEGALRRSA